MGTGTFTLGATNEYCNTTVISNGALRIVGAGTAGWPAKNMNIEFAGGEFVYGSADALDHCGRFRPQADGEVVKVGVDEGVDFTTTSTLSKTGDFEKTRGGRLTFTNAPAWSGATTISAGTLVVPAGANLHKLTISDGAKLELAGSDTWSNGSVNTLFTCTADSDVPVIGKNLVVTGLSVAAKPVMQLETVDGVTTVVVKIEDNTPEHAYWKGGAADDAAARMNWVDADNEPIVCDIGTLTTLHFADDTAPAANFATAVKVAAVSIEADCEIGGERKIEIGTTEQNGASPVDVKAGILKLGSDNPFASGDGLEYVSLYVEGGAGLDLNGHSLLVGKASQRDLEHARCLVTNSNDEVTGEITVGCGNRLPDFNSRAVLGGNLRYVVTGTAAVHFRSGTEIPNTHTGGTVFDGNAQTRFFDPGVFGTGPIVFRNGGNLFLPSSGFVNRQTYVNAIEIIGENNKLCLDMNGGNDWQKFSGNVTGSGTLTISMGHKPSYYFTGDWSAFTGRLINDCSTTISGQWGGVYFEYAQDGMPLAELQLTPREPNRTYFTELKNVGSGEAFEIGMLTTATSDPSAYSETKMIAYKNDPVTLRVGGSNSDGLFAGILADGSSGYDKSTLSVEKVGTGTWTLNNVTSKISGGFTVSGGTLNFGDADYPVEEYNCGSAVTVKSGARLGGKGSLAMPAVFEAGAVYSLAEDLDFKGGATFAAGAVIEATIGSTGVLKATGQTLDLTEVKIHVTGDYTKENAPYNLATLGAGTTAVGRPTLDKGTKGWSVRVVDGEMRLQRIAGLCICIR